MINAGRNATDADGHSVIQLRAAQAATRIHEIELIGDNAPAVSIVNAGEIRLLESAAGRLVVEITGTDQQAAALLQTLVRGGVNVTRFDHRALGLEERYRRTFGEK